VDNAAEAHCCEMPIERRLIIQIEQGIVLSDAIE